MAKRDIEGRYLDGWLFCKSCGRIHVLKFDTISVLLYKPSRPIDH